MATKSEIRTTLARTEELAKRLGLVEEHHRLVLFDAEVTAGIQWSVRLVGTTAEGGTQRHTRALTFLPDSGEGLGQTKREAQETLRVVNGVLSALVHK